MHIGMMMRPPRASVSLIAQAIAILRRYGGSLWVADPAYVFTGSDGSGAASDGSDTGYVRDLCGNARPLTQATTGFKPKLRRVPKKLGPELVTNGDFSSATGWTLNTGWTIGSGTLAASSPASFTGAFQVGRAVQAGKQYRLSLNCTAFTSGSFRLRILQNGVNTFSGTLAATGYYTIDYTASADGSLDIYVQALTVGALVATFDDCSFREVLEWGWAWVFDGTDDVLATVSQAAAASETLAVTKRMNSLPTGTRTAMSKAGTNTGVELYANASVYNNSQIGTGSAYVYKSAFGAVSTAVHSAVVTPTTRQIRVNGSSAGVEAITFSSAAATIKVGGGTAAFNGEIFAAAYIPGTPPDAEMLIVERAMAQLGGITI